MSEEGQGQKRHGELFKHLPSAVNTEEDTSHNGRQEEQSTQNDTEEQS